MLHHLCVIKMANGEEKLTGNIRAVLDSIEIPNVQEIVVHGDVAVIRILGGISSVEMSAIMAKLAVAHISGLGDSLEIEVIIV